MHISLSFVPVTVKCFSPFQTPNIASYQYWRTPAQPLMLQEQVSTPPIPAPGRLYCPLKTPHTQIKQVQVNQASTTVQSYAPGYHKQLTKEIVAWSEGETQCQDDLGASGAFAVAIMFVRLRPWPRSSRILPDTAEGYPRDSISCTTSEALSRSSAVRNARVMASYVLGSLFSFPTVS